MKNDTHEWIKIEKEIGIVGISAYAKNEIGEVVNIQLPKVGRIVKAHEEVCILESAKSAIDVSSPVSGKIVEVNEKLKKNLRLINEKPESEGWLFKILIAPSRGKNAQS
jgi:glycine cleavage system H protein